MECWVQARHHAAQSRAQLQGTLVTVKDGELCLCDAHEANVACLQCVRFATLRSASLQTPLIAEG